MSRKFYAITALGWAVCIAAAHYFSDKDPVVSSMCLMAMALCPFLSPPEPHERSR